MKAKKLSSMLSTSALLLALRSACGGQDQTGGQTSQTPTPSQSSSQSSENANTSSSPSDSTQPASGTVDDSSITTNGGEIISLSALEYQSDSAASTVYYISDITSEAMVAV